MCNNSVLFNHERNTLLVITASKVRLQAVQLRNHGSIRGTSNRSVSTPHRSDQHHGPSSLPFNGYWKLFAQEYNNWRLKLSFHLCLAQKTKMSDAIPNTSAYVVVVVIAAAAASSSSSFFFFFFLLLLLLL